MGLFGSRTRTQVGTSISRVIDDGVLPNSIVTGALKAQMQSDGQMIEHAVEELSGGLGIRMHQLYRYGRDKYVNGLPSGTSLLNLKGRAIIQSAIEAQVGSPIALNYYQVGPINMLHLGWHLLVRDYAYNSLDNSLLVNGTKGYLSNMQPVVKDATVTEMEAGVMDQWGVSPLAGVTPARKYPLDVPNAAVFVIDSAAAADYIMVDYCYEVDVTKLVEGINVTTKEIRTGKFNMAVTGWDMEATYHQARYSVNSKDGYWLYKVGSNTNAAVEAVFNTQFNPSGTFFPMAYFRFNKTAITAQNNPTEQASTAKMLKYINMDFDEVAGAINENPDIADVEQAILTLGVPAVTENEIERRYLFDFFNNLFESASLQTGATSKADWEYDIFKRLNERRPASAIVIQDKKFKMALSWSTIIRRRVSGKVADVGKHHSGTNFKVDGKTAVTLAGMEINWGPQIPMHIYRRQLTESVYEEIQVQNLSMKYYVYGDYTTTGDEDNEKILLIPVDFTISSRYNVPDRELLYARSLHYVFNSRVVTKLKWYQTGIFKVVTIIVAIVITVMSNGTTWQSVVAAFSSAAAFQAALVAFVIWVAEYVAINLLVRKVVQVIGGKAALILAIVAAVMGMYQVMAEGGVNGAPWAKELLTVSSNLGSGAAKQFQEEFKEVMGQYRDFQDFMKAQNDKIKSAEDLLKSDVHLVPLVIFGETPDDFYQRTVHSGNIGTVGIEAISSYVDAALTLPKLSETIGEVYV